MAPALLASDADDFFARLAQLLAPHIAKELQLGQPEPTRVAALSPDYDEPTCREYVRELGPSVLERALILFRLLDASAKVDSVALAHALDLDTPANIGGALTTSLKRRAEKLGLPLPFAGGLGSQLAYGGLPDPAPGDDPERTYWGERDGIAIRMIEALTEELQGRSRTVAERILDAITEKPGMSDTELRKQLKLIHQHVNQEARALEAKGRLERRQRSDGRIGNWPVG